MHADRLIQRLEHMGKAFAALVQGVSDEDAHWKPPSGNWSIVEIVSHLCDEEVDDFRSRLRMTLNNPSDPWPAIDPEGWATQRGYNQQNLDRVVERLVNERAASIQWLRSLDRPDWTRAYVHPKIGPISAGALLASWAAHDALHVKQIAKRLYELARRDAGDENIEYAGEWRA